MEIVVDFPGGARVDAHFDDYTVMTDQPPAGGGAGSAPTPFAVFYPPLVHVRESMFWASVASVVCPPMGFALFNG
jgi:hypothetical protein